LHVSSGKIRFRNVLSQCDWRRYDEGEEEDAEVEEDERAWNAAQLERTPPPEPPYEAFACLNSGSEVGLYNELNLV
jgi:hypothetical protein